MITRYTSLKSYTNMRDAMKGLDALWTLYKETFKRNPGAQLLLSSLSAPTSPGRKLKTSIEMVEIRCQWNDDQRADKEWFVQAAKELK